MSLNESRESITILNSGRGRPWHFAMAAQDDKPAMAGFRLVAIEVMRFVFMMFSGCGRRVRTADLRGMNPALFQLCYPASDPF